MEVNSGMDAFINPEDNLIDPRQLKYIIETLVANLPPRCREVYTLHKNDDLSYKQIASKMNMPVDSLLTQ